MHPTGLAEPQNLLHGRLRERVFEARAPVLVDLHVVRTETEVVEDNPQFGKLADDLGQQRQLVGGR